MAKELNIERKKKKLITLSQKRSCDTVLLENGRVKEYMGERYTAILIYKHKLRRFINLYSLELNETYKVQEVS